MPLLEVAFNVPQTILNGLMSGTFERVGGVVRDTATKQVVAWLRDSNVLQSIAHAQIPLIPNPISLIVGAAQVGAQLIDGHFTRDAIQGVSGQVEEVRQLTALVSGQVTAVSNQLSSLTLLNTFMASGQVLNFALTTVSLYATMKRFDQLAKQLDSLTSLVKSEFNRDRDVAFRRALQSARDVFESRESGYRDAAARSAIDGLYEARMLFMHDFDEVMKTADSPDEWQIAQHYLIRAMYAEMSRIRCYLIAGSLETARTRLAEDRPIFRDATVTLVTRWLGKHPAIFFHKDVSEALLNRFLGVQHWLSMPDSTTSISKHQLLSQALLQYRSDFWNDEVIQEDFRNTLLRLPNTGLAQRLKALPDAMAQIELLIENYQHLLGFDLELATIRLSVEYWDKLVDHNELEQYGAAVVIDKEALEQAAKRLAL